MKFLIDMPLSPAVAAWLADQGHDAVHASDLGLHRATDSEIIDRARRGARTIVTADLDYPRLLAVARATEPSLILFRNGDWTEGEVRKRLSDILHADRSRHCLQHHHRGSGSRTTTQVAHQINRAVTAPRTPTFAGF